MKRCLTFAVLSLFALSSTAFADKSNKHKPENQSNKPQPIIRDHRTPNVAPIVRDHRTPNDNGIQQPKLVNSGLSTMSGGVNVSSNGSIGRRPGGVGSQQLLTSNLQPMSPQTPPRDPRPLSSQLLVSPGAKDQRFTPVSGSSTIVRDHRDQSGYGYNSSYGQPNVSNMSGGVMVTNTNQGYGHGHHQPKPIDTKVVVAPQLSFRGTPPVVRDHRSTVAQNSPPVVRDHRQPADNTIYGTGPGLYSMFDAASNGLTSVGNTFGIGYGSVTSGAPTRPQVVDHRIR